MLRFDIYLSGMAGHSKSIRLTLRLPEPVAELARGRAQSDGWSLNEYIVAALVHFNTRGSSDATRNRELSGYGRPDNENPLAALDWVLARKPRVADLQDAGGSLDVRIRRHLERVLTAVQARRYLLHLQGFSYTEIAQQEPLNRGTGKPVIKQAISKSILQAEGILRTDEAFRALLIQVVRPKARETWYNGEMGGSMGGSE